MWRVDLKLGMDLGMDCGDSFAGFCRFSSISLRGRARLEAEHGTVTRSCSVTLSRSKRRVPQTEHVKHTKGMFTRTRAAHLSSPFENKDANPDVDDRQSAEVEPRHGNNGIS